MEGAVDGAAVPTAAAAAHASVGKPRALTAGTLAAGRDCSEAHARAAANADVLRGARPGSVLASSPWFTGWELALALGPSAAGCGSRRWAAVPADRGWVTAGSSVATAAAFGSGGGCGGHARFAGGERPSAAAPAVPPADDSTPPSRLPRLAQGGTSGADELRKRRVDGRSSPARDAMWP